MVLDNYTGKLAKLREETSQLYDSLIVLAGQVADHIAAQVDLEAVGPGAVIVKGVGDLVIEEYVRENQCERIMLIRKRIRGVLSGSALPRFVAITARAEPGTEVPVGTSGEVVPVASREDYINFAKNIERVVEAFEERQEKFRDKLRDAVKHLRSFLMDL